MSSIKVVIPLAGEGRRFKEAGFSEPKPFIDLNKSFMLELVLENLYYKNIEFYLIMRREHLDSNNHKIKKLRDRFPIRVFTVETLTDGSLKTIMQIEKLIDIPSPIIVANCDQLVDFNLKDFILDAKERKLDGSILTFKDDERNPKWSFVLKNDKGNVVQVAEKQPISSEASVGIYYFARGKEFVSAANEMIKLNDKVNGEFYTCPVYNYLISQDKLIGSYIVNRDNFHGLGTPSDLETYLKLSNNV